MGIEIERKFQVKDDSYKQGTMAKFYRQGYLNSDKNRVVRVRVVDNDAFITIKGPNIGATRQEYEYKIPYEDAQYMINHLCEKTIVEKYRYTMEFKGNTWEIDEFVGENKGLVVAEVELIDENQNIELPEWVAGEVTSDQRYLNSNLANNPYSKWR